MLSKIAVGIICASPCFADFTMVNRTGSDLWVAVMAVRSGGPRGTGRTFFVVNGFVSLGADETAVLPSGRGRIYVAARAKNGGWRLFNDQRYADDFRHNAGYESVQSPVAEALDSGEKIPFNSTGIEHGGTFTLR